MKGRRNKTATAASTVVVADANITNATPTVATTTVMNTNTAAAITTIATTTTATTATTATVQENHQHVAKQGNKPKGKNSNRAQVGTSTSQTNHHAKGQHQNHRHNHTNAKELELVLMEDGMGTNTPAAITTTTTTTTTTTNLADTTGSTNIHTTNANVAPSTHARAATSMTMPLSPTLTAANIHQATANHHANLAAAVPLTLTQTCTHASNANANVNVGVNANANANGNVNVNANANMLASTLQDSLNINEHQHTSMLFDDLAPEDDEGSVEYKWSLVNPTDERLAHLVTQMKFRLTEGNGECIYELGVEDNGRKKGISDDSLLASVETLRKMASELHAEINILNESQGYEGKCLQVLVRSAPRSIEDHVDLRIAVAGNVDSGKSTLVGVLTGNGALDNGRGLARAQVFTHKHELETGRTSNVSQQIMGFNATGNIVNYMGVRQMTWTDVVERSSKVVTFFDLCGHEKYLRTTMFGLTACLPDYQMLVVAANNGVLRMTKEHLALALALKIPVFVVVTKIDICPENICEETTGTIMKILKSPAAKKLPVLVKSDEDVTMCSQNIVNDRIVPIFQISNVTGGAGLDLLRKFLNLIQSRKNWSLERDKPAEFSIDDIFAPVGVGTVVAGTAVSGTINVNQWLWLGPDLNGQYSKVQVKSIHYKRTNVKQLVSGQSGSLALKKIKRTAVRKGMYLLESNTTPSAVLSFEAEVVVFYHHGTTIKVGYQPIINVNCVRQAAKVVTIDKEVIRAGDRANILFQFMYHPEHLQEGSRFIFREGRTKGIGRITKLMTVREET